MKRILAIICAMTTAVLSTSAQEKEHSLEVTTGYPGILHNLEYPRGLIGLCHLEW